MPTYDELMNPLLRALQSLGGSGSIEEIYDKVVEQEKFPESVLSQLHDPEKSTQTEVAYRLAWARTYLKKCGFLENSSRGIWALTSKGNELKSVDPRAIVNEVRATRHLHLLDGGEQSQTDLAQEEQEDKPEDWKQKLHSVLTKSLTPAAFERLVQRLLREAGFIQVEVLGRTGDGGIDGKGIARIHGLMSFHVWFQCKRYQGSVGSSEIRDFRGAMVGRSDKGLFITTGTFSPAAVKEATRDGAPPIDLIDGDALVEKLKELRLGVKTSVVEVVNVETAWFESL